MPQTTRRQRLLALLGRPPVRRAEAAAIAQAEFARIGCAEYGEFELRWSGTVWRARRHVLLIASPGIILYVNGFTGEVSWPPPGRPRDWAEVAAEEATRARREPLVLDEVADPRPIADADRGKRRAWRLLSWRRLPPEPPAVDREQALLIARAELARNGYSGRHQVIVWLERGVWNVQPLPTADHPDVISARFCATNGAFLGLHLERCRRDRDA